jgi:hypothetical protein
MKTLLRLFAFEVKLIRILFFRVIFERMTNTFMAASVGFGAIYFQFFASHGTYIITPSEENYSRMQAMILFAFLYGETIMASWQYTTNRTGRMELIFNSTQPPLRIIFIKGLVSALITLFSMIAIYLLPLAWFGLLGTFNFAFFFTASASLLVCCAVMCFNAVFEFLFKQMKALTSMVNLVLPYLAMRFAHELPDMFGFLPYYNVAKFLRQTNEYTYTQVAWLYFTATITALFFIFLSWLTIRRIRSTASVYLE